MTTKLYYEEQRNMQFPVSQALHILRDLSKNFKNLLMTKNAHRGFFPLDNPSQVSLDGNPTTEATFRPTL